MKNRIRNKEYDDAYYQRNKERLQLYREENKEHKEAYDKQYYTENKKRISERSKQYYLDNAEVVKKRVAQYLENYPEIIKQRKRIDYVVNYDRVRNNNYKVTYNISLQIYNDMFEAQNGLCYLCEKPEVSTRTKWLAVDHDHSCCPDTKSCGKCIRGLLCLRCNHALGRYEAGLRWYEENKAKLVIYLNNSKGEEECLK